MAHMDDPITLARTGLVLRGRLAMPPMEPAKAGAAGEVTQALCDHYAARAQGGLLGLVVTGHHYVSPEGRATARQASTSRDDDVPGLAREAAAVHACDTPVLLQLGHAGSAASSRITRQAPIAPSAVLCPGAKPGHELPRAMGQDDIARVVEAFARAARRAERAGFDGVEVHAAHGYLLDQFLSPLTNLRQDGYGGTLEGRLRITLEVVAAIRATVGPGTLVSVRLGGCDYLPGGTTIADGAAAARLLERVGTDLVSVSGGMCYYSRRDTDEPGWFADLACAVRGAVRAPVLLTGGVRTLAQADGLLARGACDLVGVGRPLLNNPHWAQRALRRYLRGRGDVPTATATGSPR